MNREERRARNAFAAVAAIAEHQRAEFLRLARRLPEMLRTNGLLACWAHLLAKDKNDNEYHHATRALFQHLREVEPGLLDLRSRGRSEPAVDPRAVFLLRWTDRSQALSGADLQRLTTEALAYSGWVKRAAEALAEDGKKGVRA